MLLCENHWKFWTISVLQLWNKFSEKCKLFKKLEYRLLAERTKIDNITFPYKTALSEANAKTNRMGSTKLTYHKEWSFASNFFPFSKILFQFRNLVYRVDLMYQPPKCPYSCVGVLLWCFIPVSILKIYMNAAGIRNVQDYICTKN